MKRRGSRNFFHSFLAPDLSLLLKLFHQKKYATILKGLGTCIGNIFLGNYESLAVFPLHTQLTSQYFYEKKSLNLVKHKNIDRTATRRHASYFTASWPRSLAASQPRRSRICYISFSLGYTVWQPSFVASLWFLTKGWG